jgi:hypothetical protein
VPVHKVELAVVGQAGGDAVAQNLILKRRLEQSVKVVRLPAAPQTKCLSPPRGSVILVGMSCITTNDLFFCKTNNILAQIGDKKSNELDIHLNICNKPIIHH